MHIPHADRAVIDRVKLIDYLLNPAHPRGKHKASVFAAALGYTQADAPLLEAALYSAVQTVDAMPGLQDSYGQRYRVDFVLTGHDERTAAIRSGWIVRTGEDLPRFVAADVLQDEETNDE